MKLQQYLDDLSPEEHDADEIETLALKITNGVFVLHENIIMHSAIKKNSILMSLMSRKSQTSVLELYSPILRLWTSAHPT
jgi:hypothetical protein